MWEIAFGHVEKVFGVFFVFLLALSIVPIYISFDFLVKRKKLVLSLTCIPLCLIFLLCMVAEYAHSYDKIMNPSSPSTLDKGCSSTYSNLEMTFYWNYRIVKKVFVIN